MSTIPTLVVGSGGLLGRHVHETLRAARVPVSTVSVPWKEPGAARRALREGLAALLDADDGGPVNIAWCAGAGVVATPAEDLDAEVDLFSQVLGDLGDMIGPESSVAIFFASSVGGLYAGSEDPPFTEQSEPRPLVAYGKAKLAMETALTDFCARTGSVALIGRIANLYGPGQNLAKSQGLISQLCLSHLRGAPLPVWVSLDTIRDYLYVGDCAAMVLDGLDGIRGQAERLGTTTVVKIMGSGSGTTMAAVVGETNRIFHRRAKLSLRSAGAAGQVRDLRVRSVVWPELQRRARTPLCVGVRRTASEIAAAFSAGNSALPAQVGGVSIR